MIKYSVGYDSLSTHHYSKSHSSIQLFQQHVHPFCLSSVVDVYTFCTLALYHCFCFLQINFNQKITTTFTKMFFCYSIFVENVRHIIAVAIENIFIGLFFSLNLMKIRSSLTCDSFCLLEVKELNMGQTISSSHMLNKHFRIHFA